MWHICSLERRNYTRYYLDFKMKTMKFPSGYRSLFEIPSSVLTERGIQAPPISKGLDDKMLTRVFSPVYWSQTDPSEVTRRNLRQPTSTWIRSKNRLSRRALCFALLCFALLYFLCFTLPGFALHEQPECAPEGSVFYTRQDASWQKSKVSRSHDRRTGVGICVQFVHAGEASARASVIRPRQGGHHKKNKIK